MYPNTTTPQSGTISTRNIGAPNGNAVTALSTVTAQLGGGYNTASIQVFGTYTGALTVQVTNDGVNWVNLSGSTAIISAAGAQTSAIPSASPGMYQVEVAGYDGVRVTALAAVTGSAVVTLMGGIGVGSVTIDTPVVLAGGSASIGTVGTPTGTPLSVVSAASTNLSNQKATAGNLFELSCSNPTATPVYVKLYNKATAPVVASDVPVMTITVPAASATQLGTVNLAFSQIGKRFSTGISLAITGGIAATDATNAVAGVQVHGTYV